MAFESLPGVYDFKIDGNLAQFPVNNNPIVLIIGTAGRGPSDSLVSVGAVNSAAKTFGKEGTLTRGLYEAASAGALNLRLFRIGATSATLSGVGTGITIETASKDDSAGTDYKLFWNDTSDRLIVYRASDDEVVYDNNPTYPDLAIDLGEVYVTGTASGTPGNIGSSGTPITLAAANGVSGAVYTAGTDGTSLSKMKLWESLYNAYQLLEDADLDFVVPMGVFLDDKNVQDMTTAEVSTFNTSAPWASSSVYPTAATTYDGLGEVFVQEYNGKNYFWWDMDRDGIAEIFPTVGSASATADASGNALEDADFHEVNFAYDLARFCFDKSENSDEILGVIGVRPPASFALSDVSNWVGNPPVTATDAPTGKTVITTNGTGLFGNKFMNGRKGSLGSGLPSYTVDGLDGLFGGGFIAKEDGQFVDSGSELKDANDKLVDLGKYISVVGAQVILSNSFRDNAYVATAASAYAGFISSLAANSAPSNKVMPSVRIPFRLSLSKLDSLATTGYVFLQGKPKGLVVSDAPTAARTESDYVRLTTVRIVKSTLDVIRTVADPFIGEPITGARLAALETAIEQALAKLTKNQFLQRYQFKITSTPADQVLGKAIVDLILVPAFELRQITVSVSLASA
jgi:hypothetical protein